MNPLFSNVNQGGHRGPLLGVLTGFENVQKVAQIYGQKPTMKKGLVFGHFFEVPKVPKSAPQTDPPTPLLLGGWGGRFGRGPKPALF